MGDPLPNPTAANEVTPAPGPMPPQTQSQDTSGQQIAPQPIQNMNVPPQAAAGMGGPTPAQAAQAATVARAAKTGLAFHSLMGTHTTYAPGPDGAPVPQQVQNKPGDLFRSILAGAIMGGAAGGAGGDNNAGSGWAGAARGAGAARAGMQQQNQQAQQQAQQQWQNSVEAQKNQREAAAALDESAYRKAVTAQANQATLKDALEVQKMDQAAHDALVSRDKPLLDSFNEAGLKPMLGMTDLTEQQMLSQKLPPGHSAVKWVATGVVPIRDASGKVVSYQNTYSAYDPSDTIPVSPGMIADWKRAGLTDSIPNFLNTSIFTKNPTTGQVTMKWTDYNAVQNQAKPMLDAQKAREADANTKLHEDDQHQLIQAQTRAEDARRAAEQTTGGKAAYDLQKEKDTDAAKKIFQSKGWDGLNPDQKYLMQDTIRDNIAIAERDLNSPELKTEENSTDPDDKKAAYARAHDLQDSIETDRKKLLGPQQAQQTQTGGATIPAGALVAINPQTGEQKYSTDKGKTWVTVPATSQQSAQALADRVRDLSPVDRERVLADPNIPLAQEDQARRALGLNPVDDSKYANNLAVQRAITKISKDPPKEREARLSSLDLTPEEENAVRRGIKRSASSY
jgi:hypothetical protein